MAQRITKSMNFLTLLCNFNHQSSVFCSMILQNVPNPDFSHVVLVKPALFQAWWEPWNWNVLPPYIYTHNCTHMHIHTHTTHTHTYTHTPSQAMWPLAPSLFPPLFSPQATWPCLGAKGEAGAKSSSAGHRISEEGRCSSKLNIMSLVLKVHIHDL